MLIEQCLQYVDKDTHIVDICKLFMEHSQEYLDALASINEQFENLFSVVGNSEVAEAIGTMQRKSVWAKRQRKDFDSRLLAGIQVASKQKILIHYENDMSFLNKEDLTMDLYVKEIMRLRRILNENNILY